jgi:excisionase family DNA binding protein
MQIKALGSSPQFTPQYISRKQAAQMLSCSDQSVAKLNNQGILPMYRIGRIVRIKVADIHEMLRRVR